MNISRSRQAGIAMSIAAAAAILSVGPTQAHVLKDFGPYSVALGWVHEPTYVGQLNAVQVVVKDVKGKPVTDLAPGDLHVVMSVGGQSSPSLDLSTTYDPDTGLGVPGDYEAPLVPTVPGDYTFHLSGDIHGTVVDETATSGDSTFNAAIDETPVQFPAKLPSLTELTTRVDRLDARVAAIASASPPSTATSAPADASTDGASAVRQAHDAASTALLVAVALGGLGVVLGATGLFAATRRRPGGGA